MHSAQHSTLHDLFTIAFNGRTLGIRIILATTVGRTQGGSLFLKCQDDLLPQCFCSPNPINPLSKEEKLVKVKMYTSFTLRITLFFSEVFQHPIYCLVLGLQWLHPDEKAQDEFHENL